MFHCRSELAHNILLSELRCSLTYAPLVILFILVMHYWVANELSDLPFAKQYFSGLVQLNFKPILSNRPALGVRGSAIIISVHCFEEKVTHDGSSTKSSWRSGTGVPRRGLSEQSEVRGLT